MFDSHLFKVVASFCGMILLGLITLVVIDSFKAKNPTTSIAPTPVKVIDKSTQQNQSKTIPKTQNPTTSPTAKNR